MPPSGSQVGAVLRPVGPEPPAVYWRRRAALLGGVLLLLLLLRACGGDGQDTAAPAAEATPGAGGARPSVSVPPGASPTPTTSASPGGTPTPSPSPGATRSPSSSPSVAAAPPTCTSGALSVTAASDARVYAAGARPRLTLLVVNTAAAPCRVDLGQAQRELRVLSGPDRVWSSDDCAPGGAPEPRVLAPRQQVAYAVTWSRTRSRPGCAGAKEPARPGTYRVVGRLGDRRSEGAVFTLR